MQSGEQEGESADKHKGMRTQEGPGRSAAAGSGLYREAAPERTMAAGTRNSGEPRKAHKGRFLGHVARESRTSGRLPAGGTI